MKKVDELKYYYDPEARRLFICRNGKHVGGFQGNYAEKHFKELLDTGANISITSMDKDFKRKSLVRKLRATWIKQGIDKHREHILNSYGVESTADLSIEQLKELLEKYTPDLKISDEIRKLRANVLVLLSRIGVYNDQNWEDVNAYLLNPKICGKLLYQLSSDELKSLIRKLNSIADKHSAKDKYYRNLSLLN